MRSTPAACAASGADSAARYASKRAWGFAKCDALASRAVAWRTAQLLQPREQLGQRLRANQREALMVAIESDHLIGWPNTPDDSATARQHR